VCSGVSTRLSPTTNPLLARSLCCYVVWVEIRDKYNLTSIINARGTFTPLGVSRSSKAVCDAVAAALSDYFVVDELQAVAGQKIAQWAGTDAGAVSHCVAAAITTSIAAAMAGNCNEKIAALPDTTGMRCRVVLPAGHAVNYGHPIEQAIRLAGAKPIRAGSDERCSIEEIEQEIAHPDTSCLLLVSSRLARGEPVDLRAAVDAAHSRGIPAIIDGAAQDMRIGELVSTKADIVLVSAQKYLAAPTAGLIIGKQSLVDAVRAQDKGIGRGMKASKEAILGVLAALEQRDQRDGLSWSNEQESKVIDFVQCANCINGIQARILDDPTGLPFVRAGLKIDADSPRKTAIELVSALKSGKPSIWVMDDKVDDDEIGLELVQVTNGEIKVVLDRLTELLA